MPQPQGKWQGSSEKGQYESGSGQLHDTWRWVQKGKAKPVMKVHMSKQKKHGLKPQKGVPGPNRNTHLKCNFEENSNVSEECMWLDYRIIIGLK